MQTDPTILHAEPECQHIADDALTLTLCGSVISVAKLFQTRPRKGENFSHHAAVPSR